MAIDTYASIPAEIAQQSPEQPIDPAVLRRQGVDDKAIVGWITNQKNRLDTHRAQKQVIWDDCWALYRGEEDFRDNEEWQSKVVLPKSFNSVKQATNLMMRLLQVSDEPWTIDPTNPDDAVSAIRGGQIADLVKVFWDQPDFLKAVSEGIESSFIMGIGVWKLWWGFTEREKLRVIQAVQNGQNVSQVVREMISDGKLFIRAVDPYNFFWLPGSKFNKWTGTIEEIEIPKFELLDMARKGMFGPDGEKTVKGLGTRRIEQAQERRHLRFREFTDGRIGDNRGIDSVVLLDYYGPIIDRDGIIVDKAAHVIIANGETLLLRQTNQILRKAPPYIAFSPLLLPFRTEGVGIIEMSREIHRAMNKLTNMSIDTLQWRLLPTFEAIPDVYENPEELDTALVPGKILKRDPGQMGQPGLTQLVTQDISPGTPQVQSMLDRAFQEGSFITEVQQGIPRFRGVQTLGEQRLQQAQSNDFMSSMAKDIDEYAIKPLVELSMELVLQYIDTSNDPRVGSILGVGAEYLKGMSQPEVMEMLIGDYIVKVSGITDQLQKSNQIENIVQFMNLIGQNPEAWLPHVRQDQLLYRILEAFRPGIRDIENIIETPEVAAAKAKALEMSKLTPDILRIQKELIGMAAQFQREDKLDAVAQQLTGPTEQVLLAEQEQAELAQKDALVAQARQRELADLQFEAQKAQLEASIAEANRVKAGQMPAANKKEQKPKGKN